MKPFFCINTSSKEKRAVLNGAEFVIASVDENYLTEYRKTSAKIKMIKEKAELPNILKIAMVLSGLVAVLSIASVIMSFFDAARAVALAGDGYIKLIAAAIIGALFCGFLIFYGTKRKAKVLESDEFKYLQKKLDDTVKEMEKELGVPEDASDTEVLAFPYKEKGEGIEINTAKDGYKKADNCKFKLFKEGDKLVLCALDKKFGFDLSSLKGLEKEKESLLLSFWHKKEKYDSENFKAHKMDYRNSCVIIKEYISLYFENEVEGSEEKEIWTVNFPVYEKETVEKVTGLKIA